MQAGVDGKAAALDDTLRLCKRGETSKRAEHEGKDGSCFGGKRAGSQQFQPRGHLKKTGAENLGKIWNKRKKKEHSVQDGK